MTRAISGISSGLGAERVNLEKLERGLADLGLEADKTMLERFSLFREALLSTPHNLTAIRDPERILVDHFLDSVVGLPFLPPAEGRVFCDIGSGAGFPLLPMKILRPAMHCVFIDSRMKSTDFIEATAKRLGLENVSTIHDHTTQLVKKMRDCFDVIVTRAFGDVAKSIQSAFPFLKKGGLLLLYKGPKVFEEIAAVPKNLLKMAEIQEPMEVRVPFQEKSRYLLKVLKS
jgi:16S rRNA (guanine527-N7)-methyltransferase